MRLPAALATLATLTLLSGCGSASNQPATATAPGSSAPAVTPANPGSAGTADTLIVAELDGSHVLHQPALAQQLLSALRASPTPRGQAVCNAAMSLGPHWSAFQSSGLTLAVLEQGCNSFTLVDGGGRRNLALDPGTQTLLGSAYTAAGRPSSGFAAITSVRSTRGSLAVTADLTQLAHDLAQVTPALGGCPADPGGAAYDFMAQSVSVLHLAAACGGWNVTRTNATWHLDGRALPATAFAGLCPPAPNAAASGTNCAAQ